MNKLRFGWMLALLGFMALGCGDEEESTAFELIGEYDDNFDGEQIITADKWNDAIIADYDNDQNVVYTQLPEDDEFNPNKFTKTVYTEPKDGSFYFCTVEFALDTLEEAKASDATADDSDLETGCGGMFAWTKATARE
jgi:hypothetical protein